MISNPEPDNNTMTTCPHHHQASTEPEAPTALLPLPLNASIDPAQMPKRIAKLPRLRGFPVPWFVGQIDGEYDFRFVDPDKFRRAVKFSLCWVCGEALGQFKAFTIGPMCGINRTSAEPPAHTECAQFAAKFCPFLSRPNMKRREDEQTAANRGNCAGEMIDRNPGVCGVWIVKHTGRGFSIFRDSNGRPLLTMFEPHAVEWYAKGRAATRAEVEESIRTGLPSLRAMCDQEATVLDTLEAHGELDRRVRQMTRYLPND